MIPGESAGIFGKAHPISIPWACIEHIGEDLIIVNVKDLIPK
jgi:sporulation protein YlmC with PRC-barrel domain